MTFAGERNPWQRPGRPGLQAAAGELEDALGAPEFKGGLRLAGVGDILDLELDFVTPAPGVAAQGAADMQR